MIEIAISHEHDDYENRFPHVMIETIVREICDKLDLGAGELSISFISDASMEELNGTFRNRFESTDILSFVQREGDEDVPLVLDDASMVPPLGDLVICPDAMDRNCVDYSVTPQEELIRLIIHGILHLLGWDHDTNEVDEIMLQKQEQLVSIIMKESHA